MQAQAFWDAMFAKGQANGYSRIEMPDINDPILQTAATFFGNVQDKTIIDLGCGRGATSLFFARLGANVISIDSSAIAIDNLSEYCRNNSISNISPTKLSAHEISSLPQVDYVFGSMILHHIEPFAEFAKVLRDSLKPGGKAFFWENNAQSKTMIWFRQNLVGKLWIPKHGDPDEFPLTPGEVDELRKYFKVRTEYPELVYFRMIAAYIFRDHLIKPFLILDRYFYRFKSMRRYSYRQFLFLS